MAANDLAPPMAHLVRELKRLPGIGAKSAQRLAFHLLGVDRSRAEELAKAISDMRARIRLCDLCKNVAEGSRCPICQDSNRDHGLVCVLEQPTNIMAIERTRAYSGVYHILHGALSPLRGVGPEHLEIRSLLERMRVQPVREIILATSPTTEGQATSNYIASLLGPLEVRVSRIGLGIPIGSELEFVDEATMLESIEGRREL